MVRDPIVPTITRSAVDGSAGVDYRTTGCANTALDPGGECPVTVTFEPSAAGARSATLIVHNNSANNNEVRIQLSGTGMQRSRSGTLEIPYNGKVDLDEGATAYTTQAPADLWFYKYGNYYLRPTIGARMAVTATPATSPDQCAKAPLSGREIAVEQLQAGSSLCVQTSENRFSAVVVRGISISVSDFHAARLTIQYKTWDRV